MMIRSIAALQGTSGKWESLQLVASQKTGKEILKAFDGGTAKLIKAKGERTPWVLMINTVEFDKNRRRKKREAV